VEKISIEDLWYLRREGIKQVIRAGGFAGRVKQVGAMDSCGSCAWARGGARWTHGKGPCRTRSSGQLASRKGESTQTLDSPTQGLWEINASNDGKHSPRMCVSI